MCQEASVSRRFMELPRALVGLLELPRALVAGVPTASDPGEQAGPAVSLSSSCTSHTIMSAAFCASQASPEAQPTLKGNGL